MPSQRLRPCQPGAGIRPWVWCDGSRAGIRPITCMAMLLSSTTIRFCDGATNLSPAVIASSTECARIKAMAADIEVSAPSSAVHSSAATSPGGVTVPRS